MHFILIIFLEFYILLIIIAAKRSDHLMSFTLQRMRMLLDVTVVRKLSIVSIYDRL